MTDDLIGKSLGQFAILEEIGRGGMASVYRARQTSINRIVAIKVLPRTLLHDPSFYERFIREVDLVAHLEHPHILPIYDYGEAEGIPYIAMRYLAGGSMAQWLRRGLPPLDKLAKPMAQIASALDYAHREGVIHRDLKPGNILLDENDNAYLSDFGIARVLDSNLTGSAIIGTPAYMSPEQANGRPLDARSDIYSLGVVLFELVTGHEPFEAETPVALLLKHINEPMPSARAMRSELPSSAEYVILKATAKQPDERYASASDLADALADALHHPSALNITDDDQPTLFDPDSLLKRTPLPGASLSPATAPAPHAPVTEPSEPTAMPPAPTVQPPPRRQRISPVVYVAAVIVIIAAAAGGGYLISRDNPTPTPFVTIPTPFADAMTVRRNQYTISVPDTWSFVDHSNDLGMVHTWQLNTNAYVTLWLIDKAKLGAASSDLPALVDAFESQEVRPRSFLHFLDEATAEDGSLRRSYRLEGANDPGFPAGQTDIFYLDRGNELAVVEMYASYQQGNDLVPMFQAVLDSLRVTQA